MPLLLFEIFSFEIRFLKYLKNSFIDLPILEKGKNFRGAGGVKNFKGSKSARKLLAKSQNFVKLSKKSTKNFGRQILIP